MKLLVQGAEALVYSDAYLGKKCIVKLREPKNYREKSLDLQILKQRMRSECTMLSRAKKAGVRTPVIWKIDFAKLAITLEFISGRTLKQELLGKNSQADMLCSKLGEEIAKLHSADLVHGDLTTSNIILHNKGLVFLDFGLGEISSKIESKAVDLLALKKTFAATHFKIMGKWLKVEKSYAQFFEGGKGVLSQMAQVEARARYY